MNGFTATFLKHLAFLKLAFRTELKHWPIMMGRIGFFAILMIIFSRLWQAVFASGLDASSTPSDMLWYLAVTEWIVLSTPAIHMQIEEDVRDGSYAYFLGKPLSYSTMRFSEGAGQLLLRAIILAPVGFLITFLAAGIGPNISVDAWALCFLGITAALVLLLFLTTIGMLALWLEESGPIYLIWQKFLFILGGLMLPLTIYPEWLQSAASWLPFYAILYGPARLMLGGTPSQAWESALLLLFWGIVAATLLAYVSTSAEKHTVVGGG